MTTSFLIILGLLFFFSLEKFVRWKHCHDLEIDFQECSMQSAATLALVGDGVHNFIDGILIAASYAICYTTGIVLLAIALFQSREIK